MLPNLFVIGTAKSGTTSLHHYLNHHPDIFMSPVKEPNFFAFEGRRPEFAGPSLPAAGTFQRDRLRRERYEYSVIRPSDYERLFDQAGGRCLAAERCWDQARWAVEEYAWRFDGLERAPQA
jgi:hypothetical protein